LRPYADGQKCPSGHWAKTRRDSASDTATLLSEYEPLLANARAAAAQDTPGSQHTASRVRLLKA